ncbi:MAG: type II toxin-antitoxin system RatA family toxin [Mariprofundaceae bacterium]|nr:type II toxin-antitoxin system RatA family toxin [Mariprofundaceae bacterium]
MPSFEKTQVINCSTAQMFDVVIDIEKYPEFLPWVTKAHILSSTHDELSAELCADFAGIQQSFQTVDRFLRHKLIEVRLLQGPFKFLQSLWTFDDLGENRCRVHFSIDFEFNNRMLSLVASPIFNKACQSMVCEFEKRALTLYKSA